MREFELPGDSQVGQARAFKQPSIARFAWVMPIRDSHLARSHAETATPRTIHCKHSIYIVECARIVHYAPCGPWRRARTCPLYTHGVPSAKPRAPV